MNALESKIPPPIVALALAGLMWAFARMTPSVPVSDVLRMGVSYALIAAGLLVEGAGAVSFARARTSVDPIHPGSASTLVVTGVYRFTRNPMYVGDVLLLGAWAVYLASPIAVAMTPLFVLYMNRFQIRSEERALTALFGQRYSAYASRVRRWV